MATEECFGLMHITWEIRILKVGLYSVMYMTFEGLLESQSAQLRFFEKEKRTLSSKMWIWNNCKLIFAQSIHLGVDYVSSLLINRQCIV